MASLAKEENLGYRMLEKNWSSKYDGGAIVPVWVGLGTIFKVLKAREMKVKTEKEISFATPHKMLRSTSLL